MPDQTAWMPVPTAVEVLELKPGEVLVLTFPKRLADDELDAIRTQLTGLFPDNRVIILEGGASLSVVRKDEEDNSDG